MTEDAQPLELFALQIQIFLRILAAGFAHLQRRHLQLFAPQFLIHLDLDGQSVAIPAGNIRRVKAGHGLRLDHKIFQPFVEGVAQMNFAVGVGRPVMQNVNRGAFAGLTDALVDGLLLPAGQHLRLVERQVGLHGEAGARQIQRVFQLQRRAHAGSMRIFQLYSRLPRSFRTAVSSFFRASRVHIRMTFSIRQSTLWQPDSA